jgi:hypothetical protein
LTDAYRFDRGIHLIWTADRGSDGPGLAQAADGGARPATARDEGATSGGAVTFKSWGAPIVVGIAPGRPE